MIKTNQDGFYTAYVEIFKTGLAETQVFVEFPKPWILDTSVKGKENFQKAKEQLSVKAFLI